MWFREATGSESAAMSDQDDSIEIEFHDADEPSVDIAFADASTRAEEAAAGPSFEDTAPAGPEPTEGPVSATRAQIQEAQASAPAGAQDRQAAGPTESDRQAAGPTDSASPPGGESVARAQQPQVMPIKEEAPAEPETPMFDWLTEVAIPLGIFGLLGCFLYYLIDLRASLGGEFSNGLRWVCFWFLLAAILITRIRTKYGTATVALPYVLGLALATGLFVWHFTFAAGALAEHFSASGAMVSFLFNLSLMGLVWWGAYKVTRECTLEENVEHSLSQGFLADLTSDAQKTEGKEQQARHPGRIILWVSIIAVIAFGLGARSMGDDSRYASHAFWCMGGYVFFALFLLALTNLSAIRMDVRQRKVRVMRGLTATWIATSLVLVVGIVALSAVIPRPHGLTGRPLELGEQASWLRGGRAGLERGPTAGLGDPPGRATAPGREADATGVGVPAENGESGEAGSGSQQGQGDESGEGEGGAEAQGSAGGQGTGASAGGGGAPELEGQGGGSQQDQESEAGRGGEGQEGGGGSTASSARGLSKRFAWWLLALLLLLLAVIIYLLVRYRNKIMPFFRAIAAPLRAAWLVLLALLERLRRLLGFKRRAPADEFEDLPEDPFADIWEQRELGANMTPAQIVRHVYRAFMAFCSLRGHPRRDEQTEFEFLRTVPSRIGLAQDDQTDLTNIYVFATYSPSEVTWKTVEAARDIWTRLRPGIDNALAAQAAQGQ